MSPRRRTLVMLGMLAGYAGAIAQPVNAQTNLADEHARTAPGSSDTVAVAFHFAVTSAGGEALQDLSTWLRDLAGSPIRLIPVPGEQGRFSAVLRGQTEYSLKVSAAAHLGREIEFVTPVSGKLEQIVVLEVDPVVLPGLDAVVQWEDGAGNGDRAVSAVRFADAPIAWTHLGEWLSSQPVCRCVPQLSPEGRR